MKDILALIEQKQQIYSQLPFFNFMRDKSIAPLKRLSFAPCAAYFIMSFADLNRYVLRQEPTEDKVQIILNQHSYEDDFHWQWFLEDIQKLGFNPELAFNESLKFLWSEETKASRLLSFRLYQYIAQSEPIEKLVVLEAIEATSDVLVAATKEITNDLKLTTKQEYKYFGEIHFDAESDHQAHSQDVNQFLHDIYLSVETKKRSIKLIEMVFELFTQWTSELLEYAQVAQRQDLKLLVQEQKQAA